MSKYYTKKDDDIVRYEIEKTGFVNINLSCEIAAKRLERTHASVIKRWYVYLAPGKQIGAMSTKTQTTFNRKNIARGISIAKNRQTNTKSIDFSNGIITF